MEKFSPLQQQVIDEKSMRIDTLIRMSELLEHNIETNRATLEIKRHHAIRPVKKPAIVRNLKVKCS